MDEFGSLRLSVYLNPIMVANVDGRVSLRESASLADAVRSLLRNAEYFFCFLWQGKELFLIPRFGSRSIHTSDARVII